MKENAENPDKDFEADWKALAMSVKKVSKFLSSRLILSHTFSTRPEIHGPGQAAGTSRHNTSVSIPTFS